MSQSNELSLIIGAVGFIGAEVAEQLLQRRTRMLGHNNHNLRYAQALRPTWQ